MAQIKNIKAREVLDSRGFPTVEVSLYLENPKRTGETIHSSAIVPSGASTGEHEALELRDNDPKRFLGKGVLHAIRNIHEKIAPALINQDFMRQSFLDQRLLDLDGTENKSEFGANALLAVSMAFARAMSLVEEKPLYRYIADTFERQCDRDVQGGILPLPLMNIINGGAHADNSLSIQEFMIVPAGFSSFHEAIRAGVEVFHYLKKILKHKGLATSVGDEGGFAPQFEGGEEHSQALSAIVQAIQDAGYQPGKHFYLALDCAASEFASKNSTSGFLYDFEGKKRTSGEMIELYQKWIQTYPLISIEDGLSENDWEGWKEITKKMSSNCQLVGDDLFVTNTKFLQKGIELHCANSILIKLNQIGTVTETLEAIHLAQKNGFRCVISHRSGETEDSFIADLAVGTDAAQIKTGSASRSDRMAKYNQLLRIEEELGSKAVYLGKKIFPWLS